MLARLKLAGSAMSLRSAIDDERARLLAGDRQNLTPTHLPPLVIRQRTSSTSRRRASFELQRALQEIWMAETKTEALVALMPSLKPGRVKYAKAVECCASKITVRCSPYYG